MEITDDHAKNVCAPMSAVPAPRPCVSCPYRKDVPSGLWSADQYDVLVPYDAETGMQPFAVFDCHQQDGRLCAGWVAVHDMQNCLGLRLLAEFLTEEEVEAILDYSTDVPLFGSGREAAEHGKREIEHPSPRARKMANKIRRRQQRGY